MNVLHTQVASLNKEKYSKLLKWWNTKIVMVSWGSLRLSWYHEAQDLIESKVYKSALPKTKRKAPENTCPLANPDMFWYRLTGMAAQKNPPK